MEDRNEIELELRIRIETLERRMENMIDHRQNDQVASAQCILGLVSQVVETNKSLVDFTKQQNNYIKWQGD